MEVREKDPLPKVGMRKLANWRSSDEAKKCHLTLIFRVNWFEQTVVGQLNIHMERVEVGLSPHITYKE